MDNAKGVGGGGGWGGKNNGEKMGTTVTEQKFLKI